MADTNPHASAAPFDGSSGRPEHGRGAPIEGDGISYSGIVWFVVILTVTTLICQGLMWVLLKTFKYQATVAEVSPVAAVNERIATEGRVYPQVTSIGSTSAQAKLLVNEPLNLKAFREHEHEVLTTYGWMDKSAGVVRIPIDRAKDLLIERGLPVRGTEAARGAEPAKDAKPAKDVKK
jgi:hypothetical protein